MRLSGHVRKRNGNYQIIIEFPRDPKTGKRNRKYKTLKGVTKKQAEKIMRDMITELERGTYIEESPQTVAEWLDKWYETFKKPGISVTTQRGYEGQIKGIKACEIASKRLQDVTHMDVQDWVNNLSQHSPITGKPLSPKTVKNIFNNLNAAMKKAVDSDMIRKNPCNGVELPKCQKYQGQVYDEEDVKKLMSACEGTEMEIPVTLAVTLGLRRGELLALKWSKIDFEKLTITIDENLVETSKSINNSRVITKDPKTTNGIRTIKITDMLANRLKKHKVECSKNKLFMGSKYNPGDYVVCQTNGSPYLPNTLSRMFRKLLLKNNLKIIRLHDLRHTNATLMMKNGISAKEAQLRLGHSDVSVTLGTYSHVLPSMEESTAHTIESSILGLASG